MIFIEQVPGTVDTYHLCIRKRKRNCFRPSEIRTERKKGKYYWH